MVTIDSTRAAVIDPNYCWQPMGTCPMGVKVQLLNPGGVAVYGAISAKDRKNFIGWAALPKRKPE